jgi:hypothetical protein
MRILQDETPFVVPQPVQLPSIFRRFFILHKNRQSLAKIREASSSDEKIVAEHGTHLVDAFICEPIPYRTAIRDNCTHIGPSPPSSSDHLT